MVRRALVLGTVAGVAGLATAAPALARTPDSWTKAPPTPWLETLAIFGGIPAGLFLLITLFALAPSLIRQGGRQPGLSWWADPQWFGAQPDPRTATGSHAEADTNSTHSPKVGGIGARW